MRTGTTAVALTAALLLTACGTEPTPIVDPDTSDGGTSEAAATDERGEDRGDPAATSVADRACPPWDAPRSYDPPPEEQPEPDPALTTANVNPDMPLENDAATQESTGEQGGLLGDAEAWARSEAPDHYAGLWLDDEHGATVLAFTDDVEAHASEVRERFGAGWWVVHADHSEAELMQVQEEVTTRMRGGATGGMPPGTITGTGLRPDAGVVTVEVVGGDDAVLAELAAELDHAAICFEVLDPPPTYDPDGPVRTLATVPGWRSDLAPSGDGEQPMDGALEVAYDEDTGRRAFEENVGELAPGDGHVAEDGVHAGLDTIDWDREALVIWSGGRSGSCPEWVADVRTVDGHIELSTASPAQGACRSDFNAYRAVLAVDRDRLPGADELPVPLVDRAAIEAVPYPEEPS